jgi:8-oxo-dGTP diphosphatase
MHVYTSSDFKGELIECNEGELSWIDKDKILSLELWEGDKYFLNKILNKESGYVISLYYEDDKLLKVIE